MKILYYSPHPRLNLFDHTGYGTHMREVIRAFKAAGHNVKPVIIGGTSSRKANIQMKASWIKLFFRIITPAYIWETLKDFFLTQHASNIEEILEKIILDFRPDIIYERASYLQATGIEAAKKHGLRHFLEINAPLAEEKIFLRHGSAYVKASERLEKVLLWNTERVIVVSNALKEHFIKKYKVSDDKFIMIPNAVNPENAETDPGRVGELKNKINPGGDTVIGFVGSILKWHGVDMLIEAFHKVSVENKKLKLLIVGGGESLPELKRMAKIKGLEENVIFTESIPHTEVFNYISLFDIAVVPQCSWYSSPVKLFEYGAMGKAIIAPDCGPVNDVMEHKVDGLIVKPEIISLAEAMKELISDKELRERLSRAFKEKVLKNYTWEKATEKIIVHF